MYCESFRLKFEAKMVQFWWFVAQLAFDTMHDKPQILKANFSFIPFKYPKGQIGITTFMSVRFLNFNHRYKWEI